MPNNNQAEPGKVNHGKLSGQAPSATTGLNQSGHVENQNQSHNTKKVALGPNTKR